MERCPFRRRKFHFRFISAWQHANYVSGTSYSSQGNYISVADSEDEIRKKCQKAFCPPENCRNPILQIFQYHIFPRLPEITIKRPEKFGGDRTFAGYTDLEAAYGKGEIHPLDLKKACGEGLVEILAPVRDYIR